MRAEEVYNKNKIKIRQMVDASRKTGERYCYIIHDKSNTDLILQTTDEENVKVGYETRIPKILDEIHGVHTRCRMIPVGNRDVKIACIERDKKDTEELRKCIIPISKNIEERLDKISNEFDEIYSMIKPTTREEKRKLTELQEMHLDKRLTEIEKEYNSYKEKNCKSVSKLFTGLQTEGKKIVSLKEIRT